MIEMLRIASVVAWACVLLRMMPAFWRVLRGNARFYDVLWGMVGAFAAMCLGYNLRALAGAEMPSVLLGLHLFSVLLALAAIIVPRSYQRTRND